MGFFAAIASMGIGRLIVLGIFGIIMLGIIFLTITGTVAVYRHETPFSRWGNQATESKRRPVPVSTRLLGWGICLLSVGLGIIMAMYVLPSLSAWGMIGMVLLFGGLGLVVFYLIASRRGKFPENKAPEPTERGE
ncbi:MAG: hypothetical protein B1H40_01110 [Candidatus Latescibacteria bacterium 4484_181]|nr:MAG: hypothetical protein B1H40_01110 [Candidatus Latescibacteria bacterium 4484_181]RKY72634.1 MAG: hypothetical protein DRQ24_04605 [Candidatus Latescibacterota bacterium]